MRLTKASDRKDTDMSREWHELGTTGGELVDGNGNTLSPCEFGPCTYGLRTTIDGKQAVIRVLSIEHANKTLDRLALGWRPVNWTPCE